MRYLAPLIGLLVILICGIGPSFAADSDFLPADQAFSPSAQRIGATHIAVTWRIADGYYLYRHGFKFEPARPDKDIELGSPGLPDGTQHDDRYFGAVEIYRQALRAVLPIRASDAADGNLSIKVDYQDCADAGLCYPPQSRMLGVAPSQRLKEPATAPAANAASAQSWPVQAGDAPPQSRLADHLAHG